MRLWNPTAAAILCVGVICAPASLTPAFAAPAPAVGRPVVRKLPITQPCRKAGAPFGVFTYHNDCYRTGQNLEERVLTQTAVQTGFGKLFAFSVDGAIFTQPLYVRSVTVPGNGVHDLVLVATMHDSVYAFDAKGSQGAPLWVRSYVDEANGIFSVHNADVGQPGTEEIGILGTPVIDPETGTMYFVTKTLENGVVIQRIHAISVASGEELPFSPQRISVSMPGSGDDNVNGLISFNEQMENQRPGLALMNGVVYVSWASHGDLPPYHGWIVGFDENTLQVDGVFSTSPDSSGAGIWMAGGALAFDENNKLYAITGNGLYDPFRRSYGDSFLRLSSQEGTLAREDSYTPSDQGNLDSLDLDLGSGGVLLIPGTNLLLGGGKTGTLYVLTRDALGGYDPADTGAVQVLSGALMGSYGPHSGGAGLYNTPAYFDQRVYIHAGKDVLKMFQVGDTGLSTAPIQAGTQLFGSIGSTPAISANGNRDGILWEVQIDSTGRDLSNPASQRLALRAYDALNLSQVFYDSDLSTHNVSLPGTPVRFTSPTVADGNVFVSAAGQLDVFGMVPPVPSTLQFTTDQTRYRWGESVTFTIKGAPPLWPVLWSSSVDGVSTSESDSIYPGITTGADGSLSVPAGAMPMAGTWIRTAKIGPYPVSVTFQVDPPFKRPPIHRF